METNSLQQNTLSMIKPIKHRRTVTIDSQKLIKYKIYHPKNLKTTYEPLSFQEDQFSRPIKKPSKVYETQAVTSSANYSLNHKRAFQTTYFSSRIRNLSASLSSFNLSAWNQINETSSKTIFKSFNSLKNLHDFYIRFFFCQFPATNDLHSLFKRLLYFKKLNYFSFYTLRCSGFETRHLNALYSSLIRSSQLQLLDLTLDGNDQFLETLILMLSKLTSLKKIFLLLKIANPMHAEAFHKLFMAIRTIKSLTDITLFLNPCEISYESTSIEPFAEGLQYFNASSIRKLNLNFEKNLTDKGLIQISQALRKFTSLQMLQLDLSESLEVTDEGLAQLSFTLSKLKSLTFLGLIFSGFTQDLVLAFTSLPNLVYLRLSLQNPNPSHDHIQQLSSSLQALKPSLKFLEIRFAEQSSLSDCMLENLSEALKELPLLKHFSLNLTSASNLTSKGIEVLSMAIQGLSSLSSLSLNLSKNQEIDGKAMRALSKAVRDFPSLHSIELDVGECIQIDVEGDSFQCLLSLLCSIKNLCELRLTLPACNVPPKQMTKLKQRLNLRIYEYSGSLRIMTI